MDENMTELDFKARNSKKYKIEVVQDSAVYTNKLKVGYLSGFYYLVA